MTNRELIEQATAVVFSHSARGRLFGDVGAALLTEKGNLYRGVSIDTASGTGFCAEHSAIAAMVTAGEYQIRTIVAVWRDDADRLYVLPPCGRCREFMRQIDPANLAADVVLGAEHCIPLQALLPRHEWPAPLDDEPAQDAT